MELQKISAGYTSCHFSTDVLVIALWQAKNIKYVPNAMVEVKNSAHFARYVRGIFDCR
jgi:hypothetical protein